MTSGTRLPMRTGSSSPRVIISSGPGFRREDYEHTTSPSLRTAQTNPPCHLLDLPAELRMQVYKYALQGTPSRFFYDDNPESSLGPIRVPLPEPITWDGVEDSDEESDEEPLENINHYADMIFDIVPPEGTNLSLLLCCKQIYHEAKDLIYDVNTFRLGVQLSDALSTTARYQFINPRPRQGNVHRPLESDNIDDLWPFWPRIRHLDVFVTNELGGNLDVLSMQFAALVDILNAHARLTVRDVEIPLEDILAQQPPEHQIGISEIEKLNIQGFLYVSCLNRRIQIDIKARQQIEPTPSSARTKSIFDSSTAEWYIRENINAVWSIGHIPDMASYDYKLAKLQDWNRALTYREDYGVVPYLAGMYGDNPESMARIDEDLKWLLKRQFEGTVRDDDMRKLCCPTTVGRPCDCNKIWTANS